MERGRETGKRQKKGAPSLFSVILLQVVMVSPGTHLVKNHESHYRTIDSQLKTRVPGSLCNHTVNSKTDSKTLYYSLLKSKCTPSNNKHNKD